MTYVHSRQKEGRLISIKCNKINGLRSLKGFKAVPQKHLYNLTP